jgi:Transcriptional regulatory protein, C terminal
LFLDKSDLLSRVFGKGLPNAEEVAGHVQIGTRMLDRAEPEAGVEPAHVELNGAGLNGAEPDGAGLNGAGLRSAALAGVGRLEDSIVSGVRVVVPGQSVDGTLLAVVPIPGTGTSLAIVGYPVSASGSMVALGSVPIGPVPIGTVPAGPVPIGPVPIGPVHIGPVHIGTVTGGQPVGERPGLLLDHEQRRVWVDGGEIALTFQEFELLAFLSTHPATVFSRADLVRQVWQRDFAADSRTVDVHVSRLRHKLGPAYGRCLVTEYRVGYQFRPAL